ncbi:hypothetical protein F4678DRAFT_455740 [Xylaria arbuscula]|nr:hypothetical protein F4678DRAFT_455740 [Xylaria arbuscula]
MSEETKPPINQEVMDYLRLWHIRMAHANLKAVVVLGRRGDAGEIPEGLPKGPEDKFEGLQPYMDQLNCDECREIYGDSSGPASCSADTSRYNTGSLADAFSSEIRKSLSQLSQSSSPWGWEISSSDSSKNPLF